MTPAHSAQKKASKKPGQMTDRQMQRYLNAVHRFTEQHGKLPNVNERLRIAENARRSKP